MMHVASCGHALFSLYRHILHDMNPASKISEKHGPAQFKTRKSSQIQLSTCRKLLKRKNMSVCQHHHHSPPIFIMCSLTASTPHIFCGFPISGKPSLFSLDIAVLTQPLSESWLFQPTETETSDDIELI